MVIGAWVAVGDGVGVLLGVLVGDGVAVFDGVLVGVGVLLGVTETIVPLSRIVNTVGVAVFVAV